MAAGNWPGPGPEGNPETLVLAEITDTFAFGDLDRTHEQLIQLFVVALSSGSWPAY